MKETVLLISCEHAVNFIPEAYKQLFQPFENLLNSHAGIDFGALEIALHFQQMFACNLIQAPTSRLLIDYNRSLNNHCFSLITRQLPREKKQEIIEQYYLPYRKSIIEHIDKYVIEDKQVLHCSIHTFTPVLNEKIRHAEIGFLYDPDRALEKELTRCWRLEINKQTQEYRIKMNYPYKGISDGLTTMLRKKYPPEDYIGIEIECNQTLTQNPLSLIALKKYLSKSLSNLISHEKYLAMNL